MSIGERIALALHMSGKNRADLARHLGTQQSTIAGWCKDGKVPSSDRIIPICEFTGVTPEWLLTGNPSCADDNKSEQEEKLLEMFSDLTDDLRRERVLGIIEGMLAEFPDSTAETESKSG